jgi:thymidylate synthase (FAD)
MEITVLRSTDSPERLACQAARGDYYDGFVADVPYNELMESVNWDDNNLELVKEIKEDNYPRTDEYWETEAATHSFVNKQLSRGHYGPWEHPQITFSVNGVSRVTMAQLTRHRHMTFDVQSQRYVDFSETDAIVPKSLTDDEHFTRETGVVELENMSQDAAASSYRELADEALDWYERMVEEGVPKEDARFMLPVGTPVNMTFSGNARTMMHVLNLRQKADAQWEVRELSNKIVDLLHDWIPYTADWWEENGPVKISP